MRLGCASPECLQPGRGVVAPELREPEVVPGPRERGIELGRPREGVGGGPQIADARLGQAEPHPEARVVRSELDRPAEVTGGPTGLAHGREGHRRTVAEHRRAWVLGDRALQHRRRRGRVAELEHPGAPLVHRDGLIRVVREVAHVVSCPWIIGGEGAAECAGGLDPHSAERIGEQGREGGLHARKIEVGSEGADRRDAQRRLGGLERGEQLLTSLGAVGGDLERERGADPAADGLLAVEHRDQIGGNHRVAPTRRVERHGQAPVDRAARPPARGYCGGPRAVAVGVAAGARVGAELAGRSRIGAGKAVIVPRIALHVGGDGHVAAHAAHRAAGMGVVGLEAGHALVAALAQGISRAYQAAGVRVVARRARHSRGVHAGAREGRALERLGADLAVGVERVGEIDPGRREVIEVRVAGPEGTGELGAQAVARQAGVGDLGCVERRSVVDAVAGDAAHTVLELLGRVGVGGGVVALGHEGGVARGALAVPRHRAARPVAPVAGLPRVVEHVEPLLPRGVVGEARGLQASQRRRRHTGRTLTAAARMPRCAVLPAPTRPCDGDGPF